MTLIQTTYGRGKCNAYMTISKCTLYVGGKMQYWQYDLKSTLFIRAKMLNPYIKHGTFLMEFDDHIKIFQGD